jgi:hypothetical protein
VCPFFLAAGMGMGGCGPTLANQVKCLEEKKIVLLFVGWKLVLTIFRFIFFIFLLEGVDGAGINDLA